MVLLINPDRIFEESKRPFVIAGAADKTAPCYGNISAREGMIRCSEPPFRFVKKVKSHASVSAIEHEPTFVNLGDGLKFAGMHIVREFSCCSNFCVGLFKISCLAIGTGQPEVTGELLMRC